MSNYTKYNWGHKIEWTNNELYSGFIYIINQGEETEYVFNKKQDKTCYVLQGIVILTIEDKNITLNEGDQYRIYPRIRHKFFALRGDSTILFSGTNSEENDLVLI